MEIKTVVRRAKDHIGELFTEEGARNIGLEEVEFDETSNTWRVTVGFSRSWDRDFDSPGSALTELIVGPPRIRDMKVVTLDDTEGKILSVKNRE